MDNFLQYVLAATVGGAVVYYWKQSQDEKSAPNPEEEIEAELSRRYQREGSDTFRPLSRPLACDED